MTEQFARLGVSIKAEPDADREELVALGVRLREWLLPLGIESAEFESLGEAPSGTRSAGMFVAGVLTVVLARSSELFAKLIDVVQWWLSSSGARSVKLELDGEVLEVTGITREDQRELIRVWIDRHSDQ
jgi:hypothetical protein